MNTQIRQLEPKEVWNKFADLNAVPRPSKKEEKVIAFMLDFGKKLGLETFKDEVGNVRGMKIKKQSFYNLIWIWYAKKIMIPLLILKPKG